MEYVLSNIATHLLSITIYHKLQKLSRFCLRYKKDIYIVPIKNLQKILKCGLK